jgi:hypothetical protein
MPPSAEEAALALREIAVIRERAAGFQDYRAESSQLLVWGTAYFLGFTLSALFPQHLLLLWLPVVGTALAAGALVARRSTRAIPGIAWRYLALIGVIILFCVLVNLVMWPLAAERGALVAPLLIGTLFLLRGVMLRPRYLVIGTALLTISMLAAGPLMGVFWWWMAFAFGGGLFLSGLWLRRF